MDGKLFTSPLSTLESAKLRSYSLSKFSSYKPNFSQERMYLTHGVAHSCSFKRWRLQSTSQSQSLPLLEGEDRQKWETCQQSLSILNFSSEEADVILGKAFGWRHSPFWGEEKTKEVPKSESVNETLNYLRQLGLSNDDLFKLIKKFPEVLGCCLNDDLKVNVGILERDWGIEGKTLRNLLLRNPKVLGYNVDCKGDCMAKCTRCWVRF
ncbi:uncharacterized protein [Aristolochia californica]|uniref:uncharacterized protein n=1 Tax=Aristolochia californica TaxID=171875 RepID=UPI0035DE0D08